MMASEGQRQKRQFRRVVSNLKAQPLFPAAGNELCSVTDSQKAAWAVAREAAEDWELTELICD